MKNIKNDTYAINAPISEKLHKIKAALICLSLLLCGIFGMTALVSLGYDNSRFKDYYDIYVLATTHDFDGSKLQVAIVETFKHRNTSLQKKIVAFEE